MEIGVVLFDLVKVRGDKLLAVDSISTLQQPLQIFCGRGQQVNGAKRHGFLELKSWQDRLYDGPAHLKHEIEAAVHADKRPQPALVPEHEESRVQEQQTAAAAHPS
jgi:hypothetical protein